jgi:Fe-S-cluster-containing dehydrogenase component
MAGIKVIQVVQKMPKDKAYLVYLPFPTELCILCAPRTKKGLEPACVQHCMAACMKYGHIEELAKEMGKKARTVLWVPR